MNRRPILGGHDYGGSEQDRHPACIHIRMTFDLLYQLQLYCYVGWVV